MRVYLDNNATTPPDPRVIGAMMDALSKFFGNPASASHIFGWEAEECVKIAREHVARLIGATPEEIYFTSGATESINLALSGLTPQPKEIITTRIEHKATLDTCEQLKSSRIRVQFLESDSNGRILLDQFEKLVKQGVELASIIGAHNEIGTIQDISEITKIAKQSRTLCHFDLTQALGKVKLDLKGLGVTLASFSAHKIYGPKGVGALFVERSVRDRISALIFGGGHERGLRAGTLNVPGIVGFGEACKILYDELPAETEKIRKLTATLLAALQNEIPGIKLNGDPINRIVGNLNLVIPKLPAHTLLSKLASTVALSSSSACTSGDASGSYVLKALGLSAEDLRCSIRIGVGRFNTEEEIIFAAQKIVDCYRTCA